MMAPLVRKDITEIRLERASSHFLFSPLLSSLLFSSPFLPSSLLSSQFLSSPHLFSSVRMAGCKQATWGRVQKLNYHPQTNFLLLSLSCSHCVLCHCIQNDLFSLGQRYETELVRRTLTSPTVPDIKGSSESPLKQHVL